MTQDTNKKSLIGYVLLFITALIWGFAFVAQKKGTDYLGAFGFNAARNFIGSVFVLVVYLIFFKNRKKRVLKKDNTIKAGILCGIVLFLGSTFQQLGIETTSTGNSGFITALYIVIVPLLGIFVGIKPGFKSYLSVAIALLGLFFITVNGKAGFTPGDLWALGGAFSFSIQIILVDRYITSVDGIKLSIIQMSITTILSFICMFIFENNTIANFVSCLWPLLYVGILSSGVAFTLQIIAQNYTKPTPASLIMSLESVFSLVGGFLILHETSTASELVGCGLVFLAIILIIIPNKKLNIQKRELKKK